MKPPHMRDGQSKSWLHIGFMIVKPLLKPLLKLHFEAYSDCPYYTYQLTTGAASLYVNLLRLTAYSRQWSHL